jgi:hypothetical protein
MSRAEFIALSNETNLVDDGRQLPLQRPLERNNPSRYFFTVSDLVAISVS